MAEIFNTVENILTDIAAAQPANAEELEQFRIKYIGSKNIIKPLSKEIRNIPNEQRKDFGQLLNKVKKSAEEKFQNLQSNMESGAEDTAGEEIDLSAPPSKDL